MRATIRSHAVPSEELTGSSSWRVLASPPAPTLDNAQCPRRQRGPHHLHLAEARAGSALQRAAFAATDVPPDRQMRRPRRRPGKTSSSGAAPAMVSPPSSADPLSVDPSPRKVPKVSPPRTVRLLQRLAERGVRPARQLPRCAAPGCRHPWSLAVKPRPVGARGASRPSAASLRCPGVSPPVEPRGEAASGRSAGALEVLSMSPSPAPLARCVPFGAAVSTECASAGAIGAAVRALPSHRQRRIRWCRHQAEPHVRGPRRGHDASRPCASSLRCPPGVATKRAVR
jgi:hypothetical protein